MDGAGQSRSARWIVNNGGQSSLSSTAHRQMSGTLEHRTEGISQRLDRPGSRTELDYVPQDGEQRRTVLTPQESTKYRTELQYTPERELPAPEFTSFESSPRRTEFTTMDRTYEDPEFSSARREPSRSEYTPRDEASHRKETICPNGKR